MVYYSEFWEVMQAIAWETIVKRWSKQKKEALIRGEYEKLPELSKRRQLFPKQNVMCHAEELRWSFFETLGTGVPRSSE